MRRVKIIEKKNRTELVGNCWVADSILSRMKGLLGRASLPTGEAMLITPCNCVHTFFMRFTIDILYLSKKFEVVALYQNLVPWRMTGIQYNAKAVLELPEGSIERLMLKKGDILEIVDPS